MRMNKNGNNASKRKLHYTPSLGRERGNSIQTHPAQVHQKLQGIGLNVECIRLGSRGTSKLLWARGDHAPKKFKAPDQKKDQCPHVETYCG